MKSFTTRRFWDLFYALPERTQRRARAAYRLWRTYPQHPGIHFEHVHTTRPIYSARIGLDYRALCTRDGDEAVWFWIGTHAEYDRILRQL